MGFFEQGAEFDNGLLTGLKSVLYCNLIEQSLLLMHREYVKKVSCITDVLSRRS